ncbi:hypothetical protein Y032_0009g715 [Ancylostoma ceylanicum]|nr:hypothetical protein Y032_0009g715 [Ancylostoma ceylanicum]
MASAMLTIFHGFGDVDHSSVAQFSDGHPGSSALSGITLEKFQTQFSVLGFRSSRVRCTRFKWRLFSLPWQEFRENAH